MRPGLKAGPLRRGVGKRPALTVRRDLKKEWWGLSRKVPNLGLDAMAFTNSKKIAFPWRLQPTDLFRGKGKGARIHYSARLRVEKWVSRLSPGECGFLF